MNETLNNLEVAMFYLMIIAYLSSTMLYWLTLVRKKGMA